MSKRSVIPKKKEKRYNKRHTKSMAHKKTHAKFRRMSRNSITGQFTTLGDLSREYDLKLKGDLSVPITEYLNKKGYSAFGRVLGKLERR